MTLAGYRRQAKSGMKRYIRENGRQDASFEDLYDELWTADGVTGNGSGSYTFSTCEAEKNVKGIMQDSRAEEMLRELGCSLAMYYDRGAEWLDVSVRCCLLPFCLQEVLSERDKKIKS